MTIERQNLKTIKLERMLHIIKYFYIVETKDILNKDDEFILVNLDFLDFINLEEKVSCLTLCEIIDRNKKLEYTEILIKVVCSIKEDIERE